MGLKISNSPIGRIRSAFHVQAPDESFEAEHKVLRLFYQ